jgi:hypothetical protein
LINHSCSSTRAAWLWAQTGGASPAEVEVVDLCSATHNGSSKNTVIVAIVVLPSAGSIARRWTTGSVSNRQDTGRLTGGRRPDYQ